MEEDILRAVCNYHDLQASLAQSSMSPCKPKEEPPTTSYRACVIASSGDSTSGSLWIRVGEVNGNLPDLMSVEAMLITTAHVYVKYVAPNINIIITLFAFFETLVGYLNNS